MWLLYGKKITEAIENIALTIYNINAKYFSEDYGFGVLRKKATFALVNGIFYLDKIKGFLDDKSLEKRMLYLLEKNKLITHHVIPVEIDGEKENRIEVDDFPLSNYNPQSFTEDPDNKTAFKEYIDKVLEFVKTVKPKQLNFKN